MCMSGEAAWGKAIVCSIQRTTDPGGAPVVASYLLLDVLRLLPRFDFPGFAASVGDFESAC
jgi:hypothetical protein